MDSLTIIALCEVYPRKVVAEMADMSLSFVDKVLNGTLRLESSRKKLDKKYIESLGFKVCEACGIRIVPKETVDYKILTRLCRRWWRWQSGEIPTESIGRNIEKVFDE